MADQPVPLRRYLAASAVALAPSFAALLALHWSGYLAGRPTLAAMAGIGVVTVFLVQRYLASLARFARFVGELSDEREPVMPRLSFAPATEELATAEAFRRVPQLVWDWYEWRRGLVAGAAPNAAVGTNLPVRGCLRSAPLWPMIFMPPIGAPARCTPVKNPESA